MDTDAGLDTKQYPDFDENGYIMGTLPSNVEHNVPTIGFISHYDTQMLSITKWHIDAGSGIATIPWFSKCP